MLVYHRVNPNIKLAACNCLYTCIERGTVRVRLVFTSDGVGVGVGVVVGVIRELMT